MLFHFRLVSTYCTSYVYNLCLTVNKHKLWFKMRRQRSIVCSDHLKNMKIIRPTPSKTVIVLSDQQLLLLPVCPAGLYFTSCSDVAVSGKNHYNKQVDIVMLKIHVTALFLTPDYNIVLHGTSIVVEDDVPAQVFKSQ